MTEKQKELLKRLTNTILELNDQCILDDNFNNMIYTLDIFKRDLFETFGILSDTVEEA